MSIAEPGNIRDDIDEIDDDANKVTGAIPKNVLEHLARSIVDNPDAVLVEVEDSRGGVMLRLHVAPEDMGKIIGRHGRIATAVRTVVRAAGASEGVDARVDIVD
ncbi:MAG TPA: KH domain-containing protein [Acidimicrobiales bacterium]|nr:KH domain-containing protein [Acidimicrobiales bacterium]